MLHIKSKNKENANFPEMGGQNVSFSERELEFLSNFSDVEDVVNFCEGQIQNFSSLKEKLLQKSLKKRGLEKFVFEMKKRLNKYRRNVKNESDKINSLLESGAIKEVVGKDGVRFIDTVEWPGGRPFDLLKYVNEASKGMDHNLRVGYNLEKTLRSLDAGPNISLEDYFIPYFL